MISSSSVLSVTLCHARLRPTTGVTQDCAEESVVLVASMLGQ